ncbi:MAG TPA: electron transfer flavoprotein subunit beta/FixA family protein [Syntrophomonadaceae bacterium]|nr:electron transfer flavoprotein subunit beta/FixA family protein [Syntrophomonadaceae bacterium]
MPNILSCFKWVIDEAYIKTGPSLKLDMNFVDYKISDYDKNAIEEGVLLQEKFGGSVAVITVGKPEDTKGLKDALSRGPEKAYFVNDTSFSDLEPSQTASLMAEAIHDRIPFDIILCGEGSSDLYAQQVGPRLAEKLDIPCICYASKIQVQDNQVLVERKVDDGLEVVQAPMPVLITVSPDINIPRIPGLKDTLGASKKPVIEIAGSELNAVSARLETIETRAASLERSGRKFSGDQAGIKALVEALLKEGAI